MQGTVKWFNSQKGYGFITGDDGEEYFLHYLQIKWKIVLESGDIVSFEVGKDKNNRIQAVNVQPILTLAMVLHELKKDKLHVMRVGKNDKEICHRWYIVDKSEKPVIDKEMDLVELAEYAGFEIRQISA